MTVLSTRQYGRILQLASALFDSPEPEDAWHLVGQEMLGSLLSGDVAFVLTLDMATFTGALSHVQPQRTAERVSGKILPGSPVQKLLRCHPLCNHYAGTGTHEPLQTTDLISASAWRRSAIHAQARDLFGTSYALALPLTVRAQTYRIAVTTRARRDFSERDRILAQQLQPLLSSLDRHLLHFHQWRDVTAVPGHPGASAATAADRGLTPRELTVLRLLPEGLTTEGIAQRLAISPRTVHKHLERLYRKLEAPNRTAAVVQAQCLGLLPNLILSSVGETRRAVDGVFGVNNAVDGPKTARTPGQMS